MDLKAARPPVAKKVPKQMTTHGDTRTDNYFWLREKSDREVIAYLEAENAYTDAVMRPTVGLQEKLYKEMVGRIKETDVTVPYRIGDYYYYSRTEAGKQYPVRCRKKGKDGREEITIDLNKLAEGQKFLSVGAYSVSDDGNLLAFSTDITGFREYTLHVKDLRTGEMLPDRIEKVGAVMWATDNKTLFYTTEDASKRPYRLYRHALGSKEDQLVHEEKDELYRLHAGRTRDRKYIMIGSASSETTEYRFLPTDRPSAEPTLILAREPDHEYHVDHHEGTFYIRTNDRAKNFRLVSAPVSDPGKKNWKEVIPHRREVMLEDVDIFRDHSTLR